jgi:hypothetical protein
MAALPETITVEADASQHERLVCLARELVCELLSGEPTANEARARALTGEAAHSSAPAAPTDETQSGWPRSDLLAAVDDHMGGNTYRLLDNRSSASVVKEMSAELLQLRANAVAAARVLEAVRGAIRFWPLTVREVVAIIVDDLEQALAGAHSSALVDPSSADTSDAGR